MLAMQSINERAVAPAFMTALFGTALGTNFGIKGVDGRELIP